MDDFDFFLAHKNLNLLLEDMYICNDGISGIKTYIRMMEKADPAVTKQIPEWNRILSQLKRCHHIRNQIAHDASHNPYTQQDIAWLKSFRQRVLRCEDPLAKYLHLYQRRKQKPAPQMIKTPAKPHNSHKKEKSLPAWVIVFFLIMMWVLAFGLLFWIFRAY